MGRFYRDYSDFLALRFKCKMQKLTVNAGFTCPNRDGSKGTGGCTYCNNRTFNPNFASRQLSVARQLEEGKRFFARKYPEMRYLAYFQAYTNTYGDIDRLMGLYNEALAVDGVDGIIIGTRPDMMPDALLSRLSELNRRHRVIIEYGAETSRNDTLAAVNRCHTWEDTVDAVTRTAAAGIDVGVHLILGLPGESEADMLSTVDAVAKLPVSVMKLHQLQLVRGTRMAADVAAGKYDVRRFTVDEYIDLCCRIIDRLPDNIAIERFTSQSPDELLISPRWGLKNHEFTDRLNSVLSKRSKPRPDGLQNN